MIPNSLEEWFLSKAEPPIWQNAHYYFTVDGNYNERSITKPQPCSDSYLAAKRVEMADLGITYKSIPWK